MLKFGVRVFCAWDALSRNLIMLNPHVICCFTALQLDNYITTSPPVISMSFPVAKLGLQ